MAQIEIVVIGGSAGGLQALLDITSGLPERLCAPICVVIHTRSESESYLPQILAREASVPVSFAVHGGRLRRGHIHVAPPDMHLTVSDGTMQLRHGPRENGFRPAVDPLFRSAARAYGPGVMGVILSGALDDGTYGLQVVKDHGGVTVVQNPDEAQHPSMPLSAMQVVDVDHVLNGFAIAELIVESCELDEREQPDNPGADVMAAAPEPDPQCQGDKTDVEEMEQDFGPPSGLTCPDCGGALWQLRDGKLTRYRCHVGHQFTADGLDARQSQMVEDALWSAVRVLEEHAELRRRMAERVAAAGMQAVSGGFADSAHESQQAHTIRKLLFGSTAPPPRQASSTRPAAKRGAAKKAKARRRSR